VRGLADGVVSVTLAAYLTGLGFGPFRVRAIVTATLLGSAAVTLGVGLLGYRLSRPRILLGASGLMAATGLGFAGFTACITFLLMRMAVSQMDVPARQAFVMALVPPKNARRPPASPTSPAAWRPASPP
jgi:MFS family permease